MRYDKDLQFLAECRNEDLKTLADYLTHDAKGEIRMAEQLTDTDAYLCNYPDNMRNMWREVANELHRIRIASSTSYMKILPSPM